MLSNNAEEWFMRMITENVVRKIWSRCIGSADSYISKFDFYLSEEQHEYILKSLTSQKESLLSHLPKGGKLSKEQVNEIEEDIYKALKGQAHKHVLENALPNMKAELKLLGKMIDQLELLKKKIQQGDFRYKGSDKSGWVGADVVVTADSTIDPRESHEKIVLISNPRPLTRLMESLRDICNPYLNYVNKYEFYGRIADIANHYIAKNGDPGIDQKELQMLIIEDVTKNIIKHVRSFEAKIEQLKKDVSR